MNKMEEENQEIKKKAKILYFIIFGVVLVLIVGGIFVYSKMNNQSVLELLPNFAQGIIAQVRDIVELTIPEPLEGTTNATGENWAFDCFMDFGGGSGSGTSGNGNWTYCDGAGCIPDTILNSTTTDLTGSDTNGLYSCSGNGCGNVHSFQTVTVNIAGDYSIRCEAIDQDGPLFQSSIVNISVTSGAVININLNDSYGLNSSLGRVDEFNTSNLEEIEYIELNFSISATNNIGSWYLNFTANGTNGCSLGNKQHNVCYNYSNPTATKWIQFINGTDTNTFNGTIGVQGDRIDVIQTGSGTDINLSFRLDEHYNPNVFKHYDALFDFSEIKWQNETDQRITNDTYLRIHINESLIPLDADQYKLDFRVNYSSVPPDPHLNAYACNSTYSNEDPETYEGCSLITQKFPNELQDDGTKFRGIFTKNLLNGIGDLKYIILLTHETNITKYYFIKTYNATAPGYTTHWEYSNNGGSNWNNLGDGYETELNINWFYNGANPTAFVYNLWINDTTGLTNTLEGNITWNINPTNNYPPVISISNPKHGSSSIINNPYNITFSVADPNNDNTNVSLFLYQGTLNETIATDMNQSNISYYWTTSKISGIYNLSLQACELGTSDLFCVTDNHTITIDNDAPAMSDENTNETEIKQNRKFCLNITATEMYVDVDVILAEVYNTTNWVNYTMSDTASGCDGIPADDIYGVDIQGTAVGLWNYSKTYANDTLGNFGEYDFTDLIINVTEIYGILEVSIELPIDNSNYSTGDVNLTINSTVSCVGDAGDICGWVFALARYNLTANPDTAINVTEGENPFFIISSISNFSDNFSVDTSSNYEGIVSGNAIPTITVSGGELNFLVDGQGAPRSTMNYARRTTNYNISPNTDFDFQVEGRIHATSDSRSVGIRLTTNDLSTWLIIRYSSFGGTILVQTNDGTLNSTGDITNDDSYRSYRIKRVGDIYSLWADNSTGSPILLWNSNISILDGELFEYGVISDVTSSDTSNANAWYDDWNFITQKNPLTSTQTLEAGESETFNWTLNITTITENITYLIDVFFNSSFGSVNIADNNTDDRRVNLNLGGLPVGDCWADITGGIYVPSGCEYYTESAYIT